MFYIYVNSALNPKGMLTKIFLLVLLITTGFSETLYSATITTAGNGNWNSTANNAPWPGGVVPATTDDVVIANGNNVTVTANATCSSLSINGGNTNSYVTINNGFSLFVTNATTITSSSNGINKYILVNGTFQTASFITNSGGNTQDAFLNIAAGSVTVTGDITMNAASALRNYILFSGSGNLYLGGTFAANGYLTSTAGGNTTAPTSGTVIYNGTGQTILDCSYYNLTFSTSGTKTLTVAGARTANILTVDANVTLLLNGNNILTPVSASINGNVTIQNTASLAKGAGTINFNNGSVYEHGRNGGNITTATWNAVSTCLVTGITNTLCTGLNQTFSNFTWDCTGHTGSLNFNGNLSNIANTLSIKSTGTGNILLLPTSGQSITIGGNFDISGGTLYPVNGAGRIVSIYISGNFNQTGGSILNPNGSCLIYFQKSDTQTFTKTAGTISGNVNFQVGNSTATTLDMGTSVATGSGTFTVSSGATLATGNTGGISSSGATGSVQVTGTRTFNTGASYTYNGTSGAQVTGTGLPATVNNLTINNSNGVTLTNTTTVGGTFTLTDGTFNCNTNSRDLTFNGGVTYTGGSLTAGPTVTYAGIAAQDFIPGTYNTLTISNTNTHTLKGAVTVNTAFTNSGGGTIDCGAYNLTLNGSVVCGGSLTATSNSTVTYAGANPNILPGTYYNLVINGTGTATLCGNVVVNGSITLNNNLNTGTYNLTLNGAAAYTSGTLTGTAGTITYGSSTTQTIFPGTYNNLTTSGTSIKTMGGSVTVNGNLTISGTTTLASDQYQITGGTGTLNVGATAGLSLGSSSSTNNITFPTFTGGTTLTNGCTISYLADAAQTIENLSYTNLTIGGGSTGGAKTLTAPLSIPGTLTLSGGSIDLGSNDLTIGTSGTTAGSFSSSSMIITDSTGKFIKSASDVNGLAMTYPVGTTGKYTPMVISGGVSGSGSGTLSVRAVSGNHPSAVAGTLALSKYWEVRTTGITLNGGNAAFTYHSTEALVDPSTLAAMQYSGGSWATPSSSIVAPTITASLTSSIDGDWTATSRVTLYSYQTGNWNTTNTWTTDPSGTELTGSRVPQSGDNIVVLNSYTVTLTADVATTDHNITVESGGILDMAGYMFTGGLSGLAGSGSIKTSYTSGGTGYFPTTITNTFVDSGGGTYIYQPVADINLPSQATYNNLTIAATGSHVVTMKNDLVVNNNLTINDGTFRINDATDDIRLNLTVYGDVEVAASGQIRTGTGNTFATMPGEYHSNTHQFYIYGNFTNYGSVRFTNLTAPLLNAFPSSGATSGGVTVWFEGTSDKQAILNGTTDFYNLVIDKGSDQSVIMEITANDTNNFVLYGRNDSIWNQNSPYSVTDPEMCKALWIKDGTLKLTGKIYIPTLTEGSATRGDYKIGQNAMLWLDSPDVTIYATASTNAQVFPAGGTGVNAASNDQALHIAGTLKMTDGYLSTRNSAGLLYGYNSIASIIVEGGTIDISQFRESGVSAGKLSYAQTGGTVNLYGTAQGEVSNAWPIFGINGSSYTFSMSGGTINLYKNTTNIGASGNGFYVASSDGNYNVSGGKINIQNTAGTALSCDINSTANLYNLDIISTGGSTVTANLKSNLTIEGSLLIGDNATLDVSTSNYNVSIGKDFTLGQTAGTNTAVYTYRSNTTTFIGPSNSTITVLNTNASSPLNFNNLTIDKDATTASVTFASSGRTGTSTDPLSIIASINTTLDVNQGILDYGAFRLEALGNITNNGTLGPNASTGRLLLYSNALQTITSSTLTSPTYGHIEVNNQNGTSGFTALQLLSDISVYKFSLTSNHRVNLGSYKLSIGDGGLTSATWSNTRMFYTSGAASDNGMEQNISLSGSYTNSTVATFPIGTLSPSTRYTPFTLIVNGSPGTVSGTLRINPVSVCHPASDCGGNVLPYYWRSNASSGLSGALASAIKYTFTYTSAPTGPKALYLQADGTWNQGGTINGNNLEYNGIGFLSTDFTSGNPSNFNQVTTWYSSKSGAWSDATVWSKTSHTVYSNPGSKFPQPQDRVIIGGDAATSRNDSVWLTAGIDVAYITIMGSYTNNSRKPTLDVKTYGSSCSIDVIQGDGKFSTPDQNIPSTTATDYGSFLTSDSAVFEYYGTSDFTLPGITIYPTLLLNGSGTKTLPDNDVLIRKNLRIASATTLLTGASNDLTIDGNIEMTGGGTLTFNSAATSTRKVTVYGDINLRYGNTDDNNTINIGTAASSVVNQLWLYGNLTMGASDLNFYTASSNAATDIYIKGSSNSTMSDRTSGSNVPDFNNIIVDKDLVTDTVTLSDQFTLNGAGNITIKPLYLLNGTCIIDNTATDVRISSGVSDYNIPSTAALDIKNGKLTIDASGGTAKGLWLDGLLKLENSSQLLVGDSTTTNAHYIEYSSSGNAQINISGSALLSVNAQIRRSLLNTQGVLQFTQTGGNIRIHGLNADNTRAKFEVVNSGSAFNQTSGNLYILRGGGGSTYGDLYIRPASASTTGGNILLTPTTTCAATETFKVDANVSLYNLYVGGVSGHTASASLNINTLSLNGNLTINSNGSFSTNNLNLSLKGDFTNSGTFSSGTTDITTFNGTTQKLYGNTTYSTTFNSLDVSSSGSLTLQSNSNITVSNNLSILSGTLNDGGNTITVKGDVSNYTSHTSPLGTGGIKFGGSGSQTILGDGSANNAIFGRVEVDNSASVHLTQNVLINNALTLTNGSMNIDDHLLTIAQSATLSSPSGYGLSRMIYTNGHLTSSQGVKMYIGTGTSSVTCPIGVIGKYTPVDLETTTNTGSGSYVVFNPIDAAHPTATDNTNVLQYYWIITSSGFTGFTGNIYFYYQNNDVAVVAPNTEADYISGRLFNNKWTKLPNTYVDETLDKIQYQFTSSTTNISGEYTAGIDDALPTDIPVYYSTGNDDWDNASAWTPTPTSGVPSGAIMVIQQGHNITISSDSKVAYKTTLNGTLTINPGVVGHYLGTVDGTGTLSVSSNTTSIKLPAGSYTSFFSCLGGTLEYGGTGSYTLSLIPSTLRNLTLSGSGTRTLPNKDISICEQLDIQGTTVLDNSTNNRTITVNGNMTRASGASFLCGSGSSAKVVFSGSTAQSIGTFTGTNTFNHITVNNTGGLTLTGAVDMKGNLTLTNGIITTTTTNILYMTSGTATVSGGSNTAFISGPLKKKITGGYYFDFPVGKATRWGKLAVNQGNDGDWTVEYFNTGKSPTPTPSAPLTAASTTEYWSIKGPASGNQAYLTARWDSVSDIRPSITQSGLSGGDAPDMRLAEYATGPAWNQVIVNHPTTGDDNYGTETTSSKITISAGLTNYYTLACVNPVKPRARFSSTTAVCQGGTIPVEFTGSGAYNYQLYYTIDGGAAQGPINVTSPSTTTTISATTAGVYKLYSFTYNTLGTPTAGLVDATTVTVNTSPTAANAGSDQTSAAMCGLTSTTLTGNAPTVGTGTWGIVSGSGGVISGLNNPVSAFNGTAGVSYTLRWTISSTSCTSSSDDVVITFLQAPPLALTSSDVDNEFCDGTSVTFTASPLVGTSTYDFRVDGGSVQTGSGNTWNSTTLTNGQNVDVVVTAVNGCSSTSIGITNIVDPIPTISLGANPVVTVGTTSANLTYSGTTGSPDKYNINFDVTAEGQGFTDISNAMLPASPIVISVPSAPTPATYNAQLWVTNSFTSCASPTSAITVTVNPADSVTISASPTTICLGQSTTLTFTLAGTPNWSITYTDGVTPVTVSGIATSPYTAVVTPTTTGTVTYTITSLTGGSGAGLVGTPSSVDITVNPTPGQDTLFRKPNR